MRKRDCRAELNLFISWKKVVRYASVFLFALFVLIAKRADASHVVGGVLTYVHNGGSNYTITLKLYRDCSGVTLPASAVVTVVGYNGAAFSPSRNITLTRVSITSLDPDLDSCAIAPNPMPCVEEHIYTATVNTLPANAGGYHLYYQTSARNQFVTNVNTSCNCIGESFYAYIPGTSVIWLEDFTLTNGTTVDAGSTAWTRTLGTTAPNYARVQSNLFEFSGANNAQATWISGVINISSYPAGVNISMNLSENGNMDTNDSLLVYYSLDGGPLTPFPITPFASNDFTSAISQATNLVGSTLQIYARAHYDGSSPTSELLQIDDVLVYGNDFSTNTSPVFTEFPPLFLCANQPFVFDHSATDANGDSLVYSFYTPYNGFTGASPGTAVAPTFSNNVASFTTVVFQGGYSTTNPLGGTPLTLNSATGQLSGTPAANGQYLVGIKVSEYRNGVLLSEMVRDFQFNVVTCQPPAEALIVSSGVILACEGVQVTFPNNSSVSATNFWWNFGNTATLADTSLLQYPTYTYPSPGNYTVTLITNKGLTCADTSVAILTAGWAAASFTSPATACVNTSVSFTNTSTSSSNGTINSRSWDFGDGFNSSAINPTHTYTTAGTYNVSLTVTNTIGCDSTIVKPITINGQPTVNAFADTAICASGPTANLNTAFSNTSGITWSGGTGTYNPNNTSASTVYTPSAAEITAGTVTLTVTTAANGSCSGVTDNKVITITPAITVEAGNNQVICKGTSATLAGSVTGGTITGTWTSTGSGSFAPNANTLNAVYTPSLADEAAGNVKLYLSSTNNVGCAAKVDSVFISFFAYPVVDAGNNQQICAGSNAPLAGSVTGTSTTGLWTTTGTGTFSPNATTLNATYLPSAADISAGSVTLRLTATNSCNPAPYDEITVTLHPTPSVTTANTATICSGNATNISLTANIASTFSWTIGTITGSISGSSAGSGSTIAQTLTNPSNATTGTVQYIVTAASTGPLGCPSTPYTITVTVNPRPVVTTANTATICSAAATNIALTASSASTFTWTIGTITGGITGASAGSGATIAQSLTNPSNSTGGTVQYLVTPTSTATPACPGTPYTITVTVNPRPVVTTANTASVCSATATNIGLTASVPSTFTWTVGTITGAITGASAGSGSTITQTLTNPSNATAGTVQYIVTPTSTASPACPGSTYTITVTVNPRPAVITANTFSTCNNTNPSIALTASAASTFSWTVGTITGGITGANTGSGGTINDVLTNPSNSAAGTVQYIVTPTSTTTPACPGPTYTITVTVNPTPVVTTANAATICNGTATNIALTASATSTFAWTVGTITGAITGASNGSGSTIAQTLTNPSNSAAGTVQYLVTPTSTASPACPGSVYTITVTVNPTPVVTTANTATICSATATNIALTASAASTFTWTVGTITGGITGATNSSGATIAQTLTNPSNATSGTVQYVVTPTSTATPACPGPTYTITVTVNPRPVVTTANTFSTCNNTNPSIALTASAASTFSWTVGTITGGITGANTGSGGTINDVLTNPSNAASGTVQYIVTPTSTASPACPGPTYTITVTVNPTPVVTTANTATICSATATNIALTASAASTFTWTVGTITGGITGATNSSGATIAQTLTNPSNATAGTVQYLVTPTSTATPACPGSAYTITVTVNPTPVVTTANTATICSATATNIALTASAASTFTWTVGTITGSITGASAGSGLTIAQTLTNPSNATTGTVQYIVTPTSTATPACPGPTYTITVTVNPTPVVTTANTTTICSATATNITLTASATSTFTWTVGTITGGITGASAGSGSTIAQTLTNPSNATAGTVQYIVTPTSTATPACPGPTYTITVTVNPTPVVTTANTATICSATATNIALTASAASTFTWTVGTITGGITGATNSSGATIAQTLTNPSNATAGTVQYLVTPTSTATPACPGSAYTITVTVNPRPVVTTANTATICSATATNIALTASAASTFTWTVGTITGSITGASAGSGLTIAQTLTNPSNATTGTVQYIVTPTSTATPACPGPTYTITVTVNPTPVVTTANTCNDL
jgi:PKD repeat protein